MKQTAIFFGLILFFLQSKSQEQTSTPSKKFSYETGVNLFTMQLGTPDYFYNTSKYSTDNYYFNGIYAKIFNGRRALRLQANYFQQTQYRSPRYDLIYGSLLPYVPYGQLREYKAAELSGGYQYLFLKSNFTPYYFTDMSLRYSTFKYVGDCEMCKYSYKADYIYLPEVRSAASLIFSQGIGLRWKFLKRFVLNAETDLQFLFNYAWDESGRPYRYDHYRGRISLMKISMGVVL